MKDRIARYRQAAIKAVQYQLRHQLPDGGYIWDGFAKDAYHKQAYSWSMSGYFPEAHRLLNWVKANTLGSNGELKDYNGDTYKHAWFFQGAHRLGRFDLSMPVMSYLAASQKRCGGWIELHNDEHVLSRSTAWPGVAAIYAGRMDVAEKAAQCCIRFLEQQIVKDRFYFSMTQDGKLVTGSDETCVRIDKKKQWYWEVALPMMLMLRMYQATAEKRYLDYAERCFAFLLLCADDKFSFIGSGKSSLASALYYLITDDERARDAACEFCEFLVETQTPEGGWRDPEFGEPDEPLIYIDHAAEYGVWLQEVSALLLSKR